MFSIKNILGEDCQVLLSGKVGIQTKNPCWWVDVFISAEHAGTMTERLGIIKETNDGRYTWIIEKCEYFVANSLDKRQGIAYSLEDAQKKILEVWGSIYNV